MSAEVPSQFTEDIKVEQSAKGARVTVHVFGNNPCETIQKAVSLYKLTMEALTEKGLTVAPIEIKEATRA
jgi:hypothetical protein